MFSNNDESTRKITVKKIVFVMINLLKLADSVPEAVHRELRQMSQEDLDIAAAMVCHKIGDDDAAAKLFAFMSVKTDKEFIDLINEAKEE